MGTRVPRKTGVPPRMSGFLTMTSMNGLYHAELPSGFERRKEEEGTTCRAPTIDRYSALFGAAAEQAEDYAGGDPVIVGLGGAGESGAVVVDVEEADIPVAGWVDIDAAADFIGQCAAGGGSVAAGAADSGAQAEPPTRPSTNGVKPQRWRER